MKARHSAEGSGWVMMGRAAFWGMPSSSAVLAQTEEMRVKLLLHQQPIPPWTLRLSLRVRVAAGLTRRQSAKQALVCMAGEREPVGGRGTKKGRQEGMEGGKRDRLKGREGQKTRQRLRDQVVGQRSERSGGWGGAEAREERRPGRAEGLRKTDGSRDLRLMILIPDEVMAAH